MGRSYGPEHAVVGRRKSAGGAPDIERFDYPEEDRSWELEWGDLLRGIAGGAAPSSAGAEALGTLEWIYRLYRAAAEGRAVRREEAPTA